MRTIDPQQLANEAKFNGFHALLLLLCTLIIVADGYDLAVVGVALPLIMKEMNVSSTIAGFMASAAIVGMMLGAVLFGTLADRIGRRRIMAACLGLFSVATAAAGVTHDPITFSVVRFIAGLGIGGVMPCVVAQMTEFAPRRRKSLMVTVAFSGFAIGGIAAALLGKGLIVEHGWPAVFFVAAAPIVLVPIVLTMLPESMQLLVRHERIDALRAVLRRLAPGVRLDATDRFVVRTTSVSKATARSLWSDDRARSTAMFWLASFMCLFVIYGLGSWLAKLMVANGYELGTALTLVLILNLGALAGSIVAGWLGDRFAIRHVLAALYAVAGVCILALGFRLPLGALAVAVGVLGAAVYGGQTLTFAYAGQFYPEHVRSTGVGWTTAVGRLGAVLGPIAVGVLVALQLTVEQTMVGMAVPALIAGAAVLAIDHRRSASAAARTGVPAGGVELDRPFPVVSGH